MLHPSGPFTHIDQIGTAGIEPASQVGGEPLVIYRQSSTIELRSVVRHIPKGASYFRIARPLRFQLSHSTDFLGVNRRRIRFRLPCICFDIKQTGILAFRDHCKLTLFKAGRHRCVGIPGLEPGTCGLKGRRSDRLS